MGRKLELTGMTFERLTVVKELGRDKHKNVVWLCECVCGGTAQTTTASLRRGHTRSCGCLQREKASEITKLNLAGKRFGRLTAIEDTGRTRKYSKRSQRAIWLCRCDCGNITEVVATYLSTGGTRSCGCLHEEVFADIVTGENSWRYNPNLTFEEREKGRMFINGESQSQWRIKVYDRDDYTCQICLARNGEGRRVVLNAHHLDGYNWSKENRFDVNNGVTLCEDCHDEFHGVYGSGDNTKEQYEEFKVAKE